MRLVILGGGGFRVPLVYGALLADRAEGRVTHVVLHDVDAGRLRAVSRVLAEQAAGVPDPVEVSTTTDLDEALRGADFVFSAIRVGGLEGRANDERVALAEGVLGQETVGAGGIAYGLRTVPVADDIARRVARLAPDAWVINFTNPAGLVTEAMSRHLGDRVIGICDSPVGLGRRIARVLGARPDEAWIDYVGLNHLGWVRGLRVVRRGPAATPAGRPRAARLVRGGPSLRRGLAAVPGRDPQRVPALLLLQPRGRAGLPAGGPDPRRLPAGPAGELLRRDGRPGRLRTGVVEPHPRRAGGDLHEREPGGGGRGEREADDLSGGYEKVALALMRAVARDERTTLILNVRNRGTLSPLDEDAVIEVPCLVDANGAHPVSVDPLPGHAVGLVSVVKAVEREVLAAARSGSRATAVKAFALHPLVDSVSVARRLVDGYTAVHPGLSYLD